MNLSKRELDVLSCIVIGGESYKSTAKTLHINKSTVNTYVRRILAKTKCKRTSELRSYIEEKKLGQRYEILTRPCKSDDFKTNCSILKFCVMMSLFIFVIIFATKTTDLTQIP